MYRIMLAGPTLLYAPLYLAKIERLTYAYKWITFCYPSLHDVIGQEQGQHDPVYYKLLSPVQDDDVILAVADPFRLRYKRSTGHDPACAVVVGGLIQRMCLWLVSNKNGFDLGNDNFKARFNQIVVHRKEMTSYALMRALLKDQSVTDVDAEKLLFRNARIGEEHVWARLRPRNNPPGEKLPFAYLTGDRNHAIERYSRRGLTAAFFDHPKAQYTQVLFTGLVTSKHHWNVHKDLVEELLEGVKKAVEIIYSDPEWAAKCLIRDALLRKLLPGDQSEIQVEGYLRALTGIEAYVKTPGLKVAQQIFDNGFGIHEAARASDAAQGVVAKADLQLVFAGVLAPNPIPLPSHSSIHHTEPSEPADRPSSPVVVRIGVLLAFLVSLFSLARVVARGSSSSFIGNTKIKPLADWLSAKMLIGSKAYSFWDWSVDKWIATVMSVGALFFLIPSLAEFLEGKSDRFIRNLVVFVSCTAAVMSLTYTLADWNTTVGALCNWAVVCFAFYKFARRFWFNRLSLRTWLFTKWAATLLFVNRVCHAVTELINRQNRSEPLPMRRLWRLQPKS